jgi:predicted phosphoribosyltransferase
LHGDLDVVLVRKLGAPGQPELALGAVDESGAIVKGDYYHTASPEYLREEIRAQQEKLRERRRLYAAGGHQPIDPAGRTVIIVDDGVATGASMLAAIHAVRTRRPRAIVAAVGVAPPDAVAALRAAADDVVCLHSPRAFYAVGQFYDDFATVTDDMVLTALARQPRAGTP